MNNLNLNYRQIHLDFHTSPDIDDIASDFNPDEFAMLLEEASVNSITCFARCHHGLLYYDSKLFPERVHPNLKNKNLLNEQIEYCHKRGIRVPIYITVQWDHYTANEHPEWLTVDENGAPINTPLYAAGFYRNLCVNTPYRDFLKQQTKEVLETLDVDGLFFDIVQIRECSCKYCREDMKEEGLDPSDSSHRKQFAKKMMSDFQRDMTSFVRKINKDCSIFYNQGHIGPAHRSIVDTYTHFELESLPSGDWGYLHFPITMRYARTLGLDCMAHTGKFHTAWGDFHSFKNKEALEYECFRMLALNGKCLIGDQLEPNGKLSEPVYKRIGSVYSQVKEKEPWSQEATPITEIGVLTPEENREGGHSAMPSSIKGVTLMLQEAGHQFDILDSKNELSRYKVLILPDEILITSEFEEKLEQYIENGGSIIASYESGLDPSKTEFINTFGITLKGKAPYSPDFLYPEGEIGKGLPETEHVMYMEGLEVDLKQDTEVLSLTKIPYFNRTWEHFCSHRHTPSSGKDGYPGIVKKGRVIYFIHPIFSQYNKKAPRWVKRLFLNALNILLPQPLVKHDGPTTMEVTLNEQKSENRWVLHMLHYIPQRRAEDLDVIEDVIPLYNIPVSIKTPKEVKKVVCVPEQNDIEFEMKNERAEFTVPKLTGHQMIAIEY